MLDLAGADAERQRAEGAVRAGVRVAADHRHARQRGALLRADHVHDALARVAEREIGRSAELGDVGVQRSTCRRETGSAMPCVPVGGRRVVVGGGDDRLDAPRLASGQLQALEGLRAGHFVHQVAVDIEQRRAVGFLVHDVGVPELVVKRLRFHVFSLRIPAFWGRGLCHKVRGLAYACQPETAQYPAQRHGIDPPAAGIFPVEKPWLYFDHNTDSAS